MAFQSFTVIVFAIGVFIFLKLRWINPSHESFNDTNKCPACYGMNLCPELINNEKTKMSLNYNLMMLMDSRNVHYGELNGKQVVFKKLAHDWELQEFDRKICETRIRLLKEDEDSLCEPSADIEKVMRHYENDFNALVRNEEHLFESTDTILCKNKKSVLEFLFQALKKHNPTATEANFMTLLALNPEPLIIMALSGIANYFPRVLGFCGRVVVEENTGTALSQVAQRPWSQRADYAVQILRLASVLGQSEPFSIYMLDPSFDNFAVDELERVTMVDVENFLLVDNHKENVLSFNALEDEDCEDNFCYSTEDLCSQNNFDFNIYAVCKMLLSDTPVDRTLPGGLLANPASVGANEVNVTKMKSLIESCIEGSSIQGTDRFTTAEELIVFLTNAIHRTD